MKDPHRQGPNLRILPTLVLLSLLILQACVTYKPIPFSRIDEPVLGSDTVSSVQFGGVYHGSPLLLDDGTTSDWGIDAFYDSKWRLSQRLYLHQRADLVVSQFDKLGLVPYGYAASLGVEGGVQVTDQLAFEGGLQYQPRMNTLVHETNLQNASLSGAFYLDYLKYLRVTTLFVYSPFKRYAYNLVVGPGDQFTVTRYLAARSTIDWHLILGWYY